MKQEQDIKILKAIWILVLLLSAAFFYFFGWSK